MNFKAILIFLKILMFQKVHLSFAGIHLLYIPIDFIFQEDNLKLKTALLWQLTNLFFSYILHKLTPPFSQVAFLQTTVYISFHCFSILHPFFLSSFHPFCFFCPVEKKNSILKSKYTSNNLLSVSCILKKKNCINILTP